MTLKTVVFFYYPQNPKLNTKYECYLENMKECYIRSWPSINCLFQCFFFGEPRFARMKSTSPNVFTVYSSSLSLFFTMFPCTTCLAESSAWARVSEERRSLCESEARACSLWTLNSRSLIILTRGNATEYSRSCEYSLLSNQAFT